MWTLYALRGRPVMLGTALLAYSFGLRHAVDADHIAAIDNGRGPQTIRARVRWP
jgi:nickel/cobalt transporter (NiCoT) family protein